MDHQCEHPWETNYRSAVLSITNRTALKPLDALHIGDAEDVSALEYHEELVRRGYFRRYNDDRTPRSQSMAAEVPSRAEKWSFRAAFGQSGLEDRLDGTKEPDAVGTKIGYTVCASHAATRGRAEERGCMRA